MQQISQKYKSAKVSKLNYKCHEVISSEHAHTLFRKNRDKIWKFLQKSFSRETPELIPSTAKKKNKMRKKDKELIDHEEHYEILFCMLK